MDNHDLTSRQQHLLVRSAQLRIAIADQTQTFKKPLAVVDQARSTMQWLYRNPQWPIGVFLLILILRPKRTMLWGSRLWWAWSTFSRTRSWVKTLPLQRQSP